MKKKDVLEIKVSKLLEELGISFLEYPKKHNKKNLIIFLEYFILLIKKIQLTKCNFALRLKKCKKYKVKGMYITNIK